MEARQAILAALPSVVPAGPPGWSHPTLRFEDPIEAFRTQLEAAGGRLVLSASDPPSPFRVGGLAVAENGAVWWVPRSETERCQAFLAERMVLRVSRSALVDTLHEAYARLRDLPHYACFVSGPSKTADIEQALVIGAHGPRELEVWLSPDDSP